MYISTKKLYCICMIFLLYQVVFMRFQYLENATLIRYSLIVLLGLMIFPFAVSVFKNISKKFMCFIYFYLFFVLLSGFLNRNSHNITHTFISAIVYSIVIFESIAVIKYTIHRYGISFFLKSIMLMQIIFVSINDILFFLFPKFFFSNSYSYYFLGNKFAVAYRHIELLALFLIFVDFKKNVNKISYLTAVGIYVVFSFFLFTQLEGGSGSSVTGMVAIGIFVILMLLPQKVLNKKFFYCFSVIASSSFAFFFNVILALAPIQKFVVNILQRDLTLTGRVVIYKFVPDVLAGHLMFGYGHGSSYETWMNFTHIYPNSQNGFIDCVVEQGLIATVLLVFLVIYCIGIYIKNEILAKKIYPIFVLIYVYTFLSSIEVTITIVFVWWLLFLYLVTYEYSQEKIES